MKSIIDASLITAVKTPFFANGSIDLATFDFLVQQQIDAGVDGIIVGGTTGEGQLLSWEEHLMLIAHSAHQFGDKLFIVGNTGSNNTREAIKATEYGFASGMHAALQINPYYGKTSMEGVAQHFNHVLDIGPAFIYNVPGRTGQDLTPPLVETLAEHKHFIGMKECAGNERIAAYEAKGIACWSGNDDESFIGRHQHKSHGVISVTSNLTPKLMRQLMDSNQPQLNERLQGIMSWLFCEPNPIAINTALSMTNAIKPIFRLPYVPLTLSQRKQGFELMSAFYIEELVGDKLALLNDDDFIVTAE